MTSQYRVADSKREEFRKYLEKAGVMDALTKVLVNLYEEPEKPANALDFMKDHLHGGPPETADIEALKNEVSDLRQKVEQLTMENNDLKQRVQSRSNSRKSTRTPGSLIPQEPIVELSE
ncbi:c-Myc-binding protein isoform X1 [Pocillopora verrucosa]|uniref:c-Myc-binding protein-like isoform X1 n=1 Tax=Pocillopora damicornis TaxID=46731 RepID=UPI000F5553A8|nr:c-Myc-binding protein-like isoform X1 [Pocillopora damicornis]XP_058966976.1 c-Myc-binding protein-like isoform X1 [Pocillopora verrucosa]